MWIAGVGWSARGFECAIVDRLGVSVGQRTRFAADRQSDLITFLRDAAERSAGELIVVVDSTNGLLAAHGMTTVVWDVDTGDWARPGTAAIAAAAAAVQPGSVLLMHDGGGDRSQTVAALPAILTRLSTVGYEFVSLDRMLRPGD
jgi:peptidoglycan/xylan/chitin deacetylase (PgdA/CDA1 family)